MSIPTDDQASSKFLAPLRGKLTILLLHETHARIQLGRFLLKCARQSVAATTIFDTDAFYSTNLDRLAMGDGEPRAEILLLPEQDFEVAVLLSLLSSKRELTIIDDLNSLYSLASGGKQSHQLMVLMRLLAYNARANGSWVIATAYGTEKPSPSGQRSLTALGDLLVDVQTRNGSSLKLRAESDRVWPNNELGI